MRDWTAPYHSLVEAAKAGQVDLTVAEIKWKLNYVRDLSRSGWTHEWKALAVGKGEKIECKNGTVFMHIKNNEIHFVAVPVGSPIPQMVDELKAHKLPTWKMQFEEISTWADAA